MGTGHPLQVYILYNSIQARLICMPGAPQHPPVIDLTQTPGSRTLCASRSPRRPCLARHFSQGGASGSSTRPPGAPSCQPLHWERWGAACLPRKPPAAHRLARMNARMASCPVYAATRRPRASSCQSQVPAERACAAAPAKAAGESNASYNYARVCRTRRVSACHSRTWSATVCAPCAGQAVRESFL